MESKGYFRVDRYATRSTSCCVVMPDDSPVGMSEVALFVRDTMSEAWILIVFPFESTNSIESWVSDRM
jgi:hypothetical protein